MIRKIIVVLIGLVASLIILEISLRIFGYFYQNKISSSKTGKGEITYLAVGDSFTYGIGAPEGKDYPSQLEKLLKYGQNNKFRVINRGILGQNSSECYENLKDQLHIYKPDIVILLTGGANARNYWGFGSPANKFLYRTRVYKLIRLLYLDIKRKEINSEIETKNWMTSVKNELNGASVIRSKTEDNTSTFYKSAYDQTLDKIKKADKTGEDFYSIGTFYLRAKKFNDAIIWYNQGIRAFPSFMKNYEGITYSYILSNKTPKATDHILSGLGKNHNTAFLYNLLGLVDIIDTNFTRSLIWIEKGLENDSNNTENRYDLSLLRKFYINYYRQNPDFSFDVNLFSKLDSLIRKYPFDYSMFDSLDNKYKFYNYSNTYYYRLKEMKKNNYDKIREWLNSDLQKIVDLVKESNSKLIIQNYPLPINANEFQPIANEILKDIATKNKVPFVDNAKIFNLQVDQKESFFQSIYEGDHPNEKGYGLMARNIDEKLKEVMYEILGDLPDTRKKAK